MRDYDVCGDCKWLTEEKRSSVGHECMQPDKQDLWAVQERINKKVNKFYPKVTARYKYKSTKACRLFEREGE